MFQVTAEAWRFYRSNFRHLFRYLLPFMALTMLFSASYRVGASEQSLILFLHGAIVCLIFPFYAGGLLLLIAAIHENGEPPAFSHIITESAAFWVTFFLVSVILGIGVLVGLLCLILPGLYLFLRCYFVFPQVVFERRSTFKAIAGSFRTSRAHVWRLLKILLPVFVLVLLIGHIGNRLVTEVAYSLVYLKAIVDSLLFAFLAVLQYQLYTLYGKGDTDLPAADTDCVFAEDRFNNSSPDKR